MANLKQNQKMRAAERRVHVAEMYLRGETQQTIADQLGVARSSIARDLKRIHETWLNSTLVDFDSAKTRELEKIDNLERTYWGAWERSLEEITRTRAANNDGRTSTSVERAEHFGDPRYLTGVQWCITTRCKILGIFAAAEKEHGLAAGPVLLRVVYGDNGLGDGDE